MEWPEAHEIFEEFFRGKLLNHWLSLLNSPLRYIKAERLIIKFVRANGLLPWLTSEFRFEKEPVYLLRHPIAVAASQSRHKDWDDRFDGFKIPDMPYAGVYEKHIDFLSSLETINEIRVATWCIFNGKVLSNSRNNIEWITVHYEDLLLQPAQSFKVIFDRWNMPMPERLLRRVNIASYTAKEKTFQHDAMGQLSKWKTFFDAEEIKRMMAVMAYFNIECYEEDIFPLISSERG